MEYLTTYKHLYEKFLNDRLIIEAIQDACKGSKNKNSKKFLKKYKECPIDYVDEIREYAINYKGYEHHEKEIYDGISRKKRKITIPNGREHIYCHMIVLTLREIFMKGVYEYSYGSIPGRGSHDAKKVIEKIIKKYPRDCKYCMKLDIKKYFPSVSQDILKNKLRKVIKDDLFLDRVFELLKASKSGIPIGFYPSQWFSFWYLQDFDHYVKEQLKVKHYIRWADDIVVFGSNKRELYRQKEKMEEYLNKELNLNLNHKWQIFRFDYIDKNEKHYGRDLDFMGYRFFRDRTILRRSIYYKACRRARKLGKRDKITIQDCKQMITYMPWFKITDTYTAFSDYIDTNVNRRYMRKRISKYDRRMVKCGKEQATATA